MKNILLFLITFSFLTGCGGREDTFSLAKEETRQKNSRSLRDHSKKKKDKKKNTVNIDIQFETKITEAKTTEAKTVEIKNKPKALIIVSIDTTNSMKRWLVKAEQSFKGFTTALSSLDWTIIFIKADGDNLFSARGRPMKLENDGKILQRTQLTPNMKNYDSIFIDTLRLHKIFEYSKGNEGIDMPKCELAPGCQWGWNEKPLYSLQTALSKNKGLIEKVDVVVPIIISDSDEGEHSEPIDRTKASDVKATFQNMYKSKQIISYGIIMKEGDIDCLENWHWISENTYGTRISKMAEETGGANFSLCEKSYIPLAHKIVSDIYSMD